MMANTIQRHHTEPALDCTALVLPQGAQEYKTADLNQILTERDACGVGIIAELNGAASHKVVTKALMALGCMEHRGGCSADDDSGDGAGIMMQVPWKVLAEWAEGAKLEYTQKHTGVAQVFLPNDAKAAEQAQAIFDKVRYNVKLRQTHPNKRSFIVVRLPLQQCSRTISIWPSWAATSSAVHPSPFVRYHLRTNDCHAWQAGISCSSTPPPMYISTPLHCPLWRSAGLVADGRVSSPSPQRTNHGRAWWAGSRAAPHASTHLHPSTAVCGSSAAGVVKADGFSACGQTAAAEGFKVVGWRDVPVDLAVVGKFSKATQPIIKQAIVQSEKGLEENDLERGLYLVRTPYPSPALSLPHPACVLASPVLPPPRAAEGACFWVVCHRRFG